MLSKLEEAGKYLGRVAYLMVGQPDYETYSAHMRSTHPEQLPMTYEDFFRNRQLARYEGRGRMGRCC